jgi:ketosteroid isomerase-like protein
MKNLFLLAMSVMLFTACNQTEKRYTMQSPEIDTVKKVIDNYNNKTYDTSIYADTSQTFYNSSSEKGMSPEETMNYHKQNDTNYSNRGFTDKDPEYEMVITDDGKTWVNCWLDWKGTLAGNGKVIEMPIHLTYQFIDGKIVREVGYWDPTEVVLNLQAIEAEKNSVVEEAVE